MAHINDAPSLRPRSLVRPVPKFVAWLFLPVALALVSVPLFRPSSNLPFLSASLGFSIIALVATIHLIPALGPSFLAANLKGKDLLKREDRFIPESSGLICAAVYILLLLLFIPFPFSNFLKDGTDKSLWTEGLSRAQEFPHQQLSTYLAALLCLMIATVLGFLDDVFDIRWRYKLPIPLIASVPLLLVYYAEGGNTHVVVPKPIRPLFGAVLHLGPLYYLYMALLSTFCTKSINILAGLNGLEGTQALIIACSVALNDLLYMPWPFSVDIGGATHVGGVYDAGMAYGSRVLMERHLLSLYFMLPLIGVCIGFLYHNWFPARVFPGDTLCYFTGMAFAVVAILGHFSKTLLLFFLPQIFNFILSGPQIFGLVPCPRHRVPKLDTRVSSTLLHPSLAEFSQPPSSLAAAILQVFEKLRLTRLTYHQKTGQITSATNLTLPNLILITLGPLKEQDITLTVAGLQICSSLVGFVVRYGLAWAFYDGDRR